MEQTVKINTRNKYTQVKASVRPELAEAFKTACARNGTCMAFVISGYMEAYSNAVTPKKTYSPDLSTKRQRRAAVRRILGLLESVRDNEENYKNRIPDNLLGSQAYEIAEQCVDLIDEAIETLQMAY
jgi:hypothetical protein